MARFLSGKDEPQMLIRYRGHNPDCMLVSVSGEILHEFKLNSTPNNTGLENVYWQGKEEPALLYNGGKLWDGKGNLLYSLPALPAPHGHQRMGWYHCIPANVVGDEREELILYNPWDRYIYIYSPAPVTRDYEVFRASPRQYNARLMD